MDRLSTEEKYHLLQARYEKLPLIPFWGENDFLWSELQDMLTDDVLLFMAQNPWEHPNLFELGSQLDPASFKSFLKRILDFRQNFPGDPPVDHDLTQLYCLHMRIDPFFLEKIIAELFPRPGIPWQESGKLCCFPKRAFRNIRVSEQVMKTIRSDNAHAFAICFNMAGMRVSYNFLRLLFRYNAGKILGYLLKEDLLPQKKIPAQEVLPRLIYFFKEPRQTISLLQGVESFLPGYIRDFRDAFGRNLLWYTINSNYRHFYPAGQALIQYLIDAGCDPQNTNGFGISWKYFSENAPHWEEHIQPLILLCSAPGA